MRFLIRDTIVFCAGRVLKMVTEMGSATIGGISPALSANAAKSFIEATDKEKKELQVSPIRSFIVQFPELKFKSLPKYSNAQLHNLKAVTTD